MIIPLKCISALLLVCALSASAIPASHAATSKAGECEDLFFLRTWHDHFCCPPGGYNFELDPPNRAVAGPRCTLCAIGTHFACEDGDCCAAGTFCIRVDGQPRCSTTNVPSLFDAAPYAAPTGLLSNRTGTDVRLDRHAQPRNVPESSVMVIIIVFSCIGGVIFLILCILFCILYYLPRQSRLRRERAQNKETLERLQATVEAQSAKAARPPVVVVVSSRTNASASGEVTSASSSELAPLSRGPLARGSSQSQLEEVALEDAKVHFYPHISNA